MQTTQTETVSQANDAEKDGDEDRSSLCNGGNPPTPPHNSSKGAGAGFICPIYEEERTRERWIELREDHGYPQVKCGHAIRMFCDDVGTKIKISSGKEYAKRASLFIEFIHNLEKAVIEVEFADVADFIKELARENLSEETGKSYKGFVVRLIRHVDLHQKLDTNVRFELLREDLNVSDYQFRTSLKKGFLSLDEVKKLPAHAETPLGKNAILLLMVTGQRVGDLVENEVFQVNLEREVIEIQDKKTEGEYTLPLPKRTVLHLRRWINIERKSVNGAEEHQYLFPSSRGGHISPGFFSKVLDKAANNAGIQHPIDKTEMTDRQKESYNTDKEIREFKRVTPHTLRRTLSQLIMDHGGDAELSALALDDTEEVVKRHYTDHEENRVGTLRDPIRSLFD